MAGNLSTHDEEVLNHYECCFGRTHELYEFAAIPEPGISPLFVAEFPESEDRDWTYATIGMSRKPLDTGRRVERKGSELRTELLLFSRERYLELADSLADLAAYPFVYSTFLAPGHTILGDGGVVDGSPLTDIFITMPHFMPDEFDIIHHGEGTHTHVLWVIPVHRSERLLAKHEGALKLLDFGLVFSRLVIPMMRIFCATWFQLTSLPWHHSSNREIRLPRVDPEITTSTKATGRDRDAIVPGVKSRLAR